MRINKYISETGRCSRREADQLIMEGRVKINHKVAELGSLVGPEDFVTIDDIPLDAKKPAIYIALNKPVGITCTTEHDVPGNIVDFVGHEERIFPIGRLDKDSQGLILLTNDGDIVNKILCSENNHEKEYIVTVNQKITDDFIHNMANGVEILGQKTKPCQVTKINNRMFRIILTQGLNRQIRRMCHVFGYEVVKLERIRIMNIHLRDLKLGSWRYLTNEEITTLKQLIGDL